MKSIKIIILFLLISGFVTCNSNQKKENSKEIVVEKSQVKTKSSSNLRTNNFISLDTIHTDTILFSAYDDDYDYSMLVGMKNGQEVSLIYNWEHNKTNKYNFKFGDIIQVKWKIKPISITGDKEDYLEHAIDASKIEFNLIDTVLKNLNLKKEKCKTDLVVLKEMPNNPEETILVIPEIVDEGEQYFELNSYILIVNTKTGKILNKYFESSKTNHWVSDAITMSKITIDTAPYLVTEHKRAFGIRVRYIGSSQANPYEKETISLLVKSENQLKNILKNFVLLVDRGEWDTDCAGEFSRKEKTLLITQKKTNDFFDILVKSKITKTTNFEDNNGDCDYKENITTKQSVLKFNGKEYK